MAVDGCPHTFDELANTVLPAYMERLRTRIAAPIPMSEFAVRGDGPKTLASRHGFVGDVGGCYVLLDQGKPVYVGISRKVFTRLKQHVGKGDHLTATLAYRMANHECPHGTFAATAMADPVFRALFDNKRAHLLELDVAIVEIENPLELYVFEAYCALELNTSFCNGGWNTFITH